MFGCPQNGQGCGNDQGRNPDQRRRKERGRGFCQGNIRGQAVGAGQAGLILIDPFVRAWGSVDMPPIDAYEPGAWGPMASVEWMAAQGRSWFDMCPVLT